MNLNEIIQPKETHLRCVAAGAEVQLQNRWLSSADEVEVGSVERGPVDSLAATGRAGFRVF